MKYRYISDCHVHSDCSIDGCDPTMMMCESACRLGLYALTITDHCECNTYWQEEYDKSVRQSYFECRKAAAVFNGRIHVYTGVELGQPHQNFAAANDALNTCNFDFVLASLHNVKGMKDFYFLDYSQLDLSSVNDLMDRYFDELLEIVQWGKFDSLAHLTYPLRYIVGEHKIPFDWERVANKADRVLQALAESGKALEVNTSGLRQNLGCTMPGMELVSHFKQFGGKYITLGSDAHRWGDLGSGIETGLSMIQKVGFRHFTVFVKRKPVLLPIE